MMEEQKSVQDTIQFIVIHIEDEMYGIDIKYVDNIVRMQRVTRVPNVESYIKGVINLRGEVIPIMSMRSKMDLPEAEETKDTRIIIVKPEQQETVGLIVDEVKEVVTLSQDEIEKPGNSKEKTNNNFLLGVGKHQDNLVSLLDLNAVVAE